MKFEVTPELAEAIRMSRIESNIASKDLASHLNRSPAYISKLEKGEIKTIEEEELTSILNFIICDKDSFAEKLEAFADNLFLRYDPEEIERNQLWFENYDWVICKVPVPETLVDEINERMDAADVHIKDLSFLINANLELDESDRYNDSIPYNQWREKIIDGRVRNHYIKLKIDSAEITQLLDKETTAVSYLLVFVIVRFLLWMTEFPNSNMLTDEELLKISKETGKLLNKHKFFSIREKERLKRNTEMKKELNLLFSSDEQETTSFVQELISFVGIMGTLDVPRASKSLKSLNIALEWDAGFILKLLSLPFPEMDGVSFTNKKQLLQEIEDLIQKYKDMPATLKGLESYD